LMSFIKNFDSKEQTVIMMQVENEIGMLPSARDHQTLANLAFNSEVPKDLIDYLQKNKTLLKPHTDSLWAINGYRASGTWENIFGKSLATDEVFMAYYYAQFAHKLAAAGKAVYDIPMFTNAALNRPGALPGQYPSAGPLPHLFDFWSAAGTALDFLSPDFYNPDFTHWCNLYAQGQPLLFVPEHAFDPSAAAKAIYSVAHYNSLGFSPFSIESKADEPLAKAYDILENIGPILHSYKKDGALLSKKDPESTLKFGEFAFKIKHDYTLSWTPGARTEDWPLGALAIVQTAPNEFYVAGTAAVITFKDPKNVGILKAEEGRFENGKWLVNRHLNGDQTHQGRHINVPTNTYSIQRFELYTYD
jgi:beta-galactosidase GanA